MKLSRKQKQALKRLQESRSERLIGWKERVSVDSGLVAVFKGSGGSVTYIRLEDAEVVHGIK